MIQNFEYVHIGVPLAQRIARWTSNPKVLGSIPRWDENTFVLNVAIPSPSNFFGSCLSYSFLSVVVITCASHAQGRRFEPGRKQKFFSPTSISSKIILWLTHHN